VSSIFTHSLTIPMAKSARHPDLVESTVKGELHGIGVEIGAVGELDPFAQMKGVGEASGATIVLGGQARVKPCRPGPEKKKVVVNQVATCSG